MKPPRIGQLLSAISPPAILRYLFATVLMCASMHATAVSLINGGKISGTIAATGQMDTYTFTANPGESIVLTMTNKIGPNAMAPDLTLFAPSGAQVKRVNTAATTADIRATVGATGGTYTVRAMGSGTGNYDIYLAIAPRANAFGALPNGGAVFQTLALGELQTFTFNASAGQSIVLTMADLAEGALTPDLTLYDPSGAQIVQVNTAATTSVIRATANTTGTYSVLAMHRGGGTSGNYALYFVKAPGANTYGALTNGGSISRTLALGELDSYTFTANPGEHIVLTMVDVAQGALTPDLTLFGPAGNEINRVQTSATTAEIRYTTAVDGIYTVLATERSGATRGTYRLSFLTDAAPSPGDADAPLPIWSTALLAAAMMGLLLLMRSRATDGMSAH